MLVTTLGKAELMNILQITRIEKKRDHFTLVSMFLIKIQFKGDELRHGNIGGKCFAVGCALTQSFFADQIKDSNLMLLSCMG